MTKYHPLRELLTARMREFLREPEAVFWTYGFPLLLAVGLGIAFRNRPPDRVFVDVQDGPRAQQIQKALAAVPNFTAEIHSAAQCRDRLRLGKSSIVVIPGEPFTYVFDPTRPESAMARIQVDDALQRWRPADVIPATEKHVTDPGARYIDFLVPGLLGMNLMGSGMWGVGFAYRGHEGA